jgi:hypothetical protein
MSSKCIRVCDVTSYVTPTMSCLSDRLDPANYGNGPNLMIA